VRLLTLVGTGGVGKTRLGLAVARELSDDFADGTCFVPLAPIGDPARVLVAIAKELDLWEVSELLQEAQVQAALSERHLLLLLDNFEQVMEAAPQLVSLLAFCPLLSILVTSRAALHLSGEQEFPVFPLAVPDLEQITVSGTLAQVAAARMKLLPPAALLKRLSRRLDVLTSGASDLPVRQKTLRNAIQWSYDLLSQEEKRLFRWLSIFVGGCTLEGAEAVCQGGNDQVPAVLDTLASLVDKSLVQQIKHEGDEPRFVMLETIREFGLESLQQHGELEAARQAHARYYLHLSEEAEAYLLGQEQGAWLSRLEQDLDNLQVIFQAATTGGEGEEQGELALRIRGALRFFWAGRFPREGRSVLEKLLILLPMVAASVRLKALLTLGAIMYAYDDAGRKQSECTWKKP